MSFFNSLINTFFFIGKVPFAPGTFGSLLALILWFWINPSLLTMTLLISIFLILSYYTISSELSQTEEKDPQYIVVDEAIGMWIALLAVNYHMHAIMLAFILFRFLDIFKPSFISRSQYLRGAWGVLSDDVLAGLITCLVMVGISSI